MRIDGSNAYHCVFRCDQAVAHTATPRRGAIVVRTMMDGHRPDVWCSDRYAAQQGHADAHQACLAHLARDVAYALQDSEDFLPMRLKLLLNVTFALAQGISRLAPATIAARRRALERTITHILTTPTSCDLTIKLRNKLPAPGSSF